MRLYTYRLECVVVEVATAVTATAWSTVKVLLWPVQGHRS
jgi:hypothetical protein